MNTSRHIGFSFLAVAFLGLVVVLSSCSKKDTTNDDPLMNPSEESDGLMDGGMGDTGDGGGEPVATDAGSGGLKTVYFDFDRYNLTGEARDALQNNAEWMKANPTATVQIEGHCDERGTIEYNLALGERRANSVRDYLAQVGVDGSRFSPISYGEERPSNPGHDEGAWAENRRAEFVIISQ